MSDPPRSASGGLGVPKVPGAAGRLGPRLALAMLAVAVLSVGAVIATQWAIAQQARAALPTSVQFRLQEVRRLDDGRGVWALFPGAAPRFREGVSATSVDGWPTVLEAVRGIGRVQDAQWAGVLAGLVLAGALSTVLAVWLAGTIARPVVAVGAAATRLAAGDLGSRVRIPTGGLGASAETHTLARDFNAMAEALERAERQRTAMLADVAHELRTPLTAMTLRLDALRDGLAPLELEEVDRLRRQAGLLARLVEDLRTLSLADAGRLRLDPAVVDLMGLARSVVDVHAPTAEAKQVRLLVHGRASRAADDGAVVLVDGDRDRLAQVLGNLLDNAIRVSPSGGEVRVEVARDDARAYVRVRDQGPGIAPQDVDHLFDRFAQGDGSRRDTRGKSGLGLAIVRTLVDLHGGDVRVASLPGNGAEFLVTLPRAAHA